MSRILRSTDVGGALRARQRGFILNPFRFGSAADPHWDSVLFLVPPYGTPGSDNWADAKDAVGWTEPLGAVDTVASPAKFSVSAEFDGSGGYLAHVGSGRNLDTTACTIDGWVYFEPGTRATVEQCWLSKWQPVTSAAQSFLLYFDAASTSTAPNSLNFGWRTGSSTYVAKSASHAFSFSQHYFVEINWDGGNTLRFFVDGVLISTLSVTMNFNASSLDFWLGRLNNASLPMRLKGNTGPFRVTNGVARNTADYEPPPNPFPTY